MKKILFAALALCLGLCMPLSVCAQWGVGTIPTFPGSGFPRPGGGTGGVINIPIFNGSDGDEGDHGSINTGILGPGRSATVEEAQAWIDCDFGQIFVCFAYEVGQVDVSLTNAMGQVVSSYTCDTAAEWQIMLPIPNAAGHYTLSLNGTKYQGFGEFDL